MIVLCMGPSLTCRAEDGYFHASGDDAAAELREAMKERRQEVTIRLLREVDQESLKKLIGALMELATEHTGDPKEGDYIKYQYGRYDGSAKTSNVNGSMGVTVSYKISYYDSATQESILDAKVREIMESLDLDGKSDYEKLEAIHDYICDNVEYDQAGGRDSRRTAYDALVNGKAVCQGYSNALYRLLLEAGIDNRIIYGMGTESSGVQVAHTWNLVKLGDFYYYVDVTWDDTSESRDYFAKTSGKFEESHEADEQYPDSFFTEDYPVASGDFLIDAEAINARMIKYGEELAKALAA